MRCSSLLIANVVAVLAHSPHDVVSALAASSSGRFVFVCLRARFYRSSDGGDNWEVADRGLPTAHDMSDERQLHVQVELSPDFERDATAYALLSTTNGDQIPAAACGIFRSTDVAASLARSQSGTQSTCLSPAGGLPRRLRSRSKSALGIGDLV